MKIKLQLKNEIPFSYYNIDKVPNNIIGIYAFWFNRRCIYVGKASSQPIKKRLLQHWTGSHNKQLKLWISVNGKKIGFSYCEIDKPEIDREELYHIIKLNPVANILLNS